MIRLEGTIISDSLLRNVKRIRFTDFEDKENYIYLRCFNAKDDIRLDYEASADGWKKYKKELKIIYKRLDKLDDEARDFAADYQKFMGINPGFFAALNDVED